jgi:GNAT superfamily N-acetyltransferase
MHPFRRQRAGRLARASHPAKHPRPEPLEHCVAPESFGVARFIRLPAAPHIAEAAVVVVDHMQRRGLGTLLLATLAAAARERHITRFRAEVLRTNGAANALLREFAEHAESVVEGRVAVYEAALPEAAADETVPGALFRFLALAGRGLQVLWTTR